MPAPERTSHRSVLTAWAMTPILRRAVSALLGSVLLLGGGASALAESIERIEWRRAPVAVALPIGVERRVQFPVDVKVGVPAPLTGAVRIQSAAGTVYLLAHHPFTATRVVVQGVESGAVYLLDLSATADGADTGPIDIIDPTADATAATDAAAATPGTTSYGYATLTRFAAQQLYAPARLLRELPGVVRVPVSREAVALVRGDEVEAIPLIAWRSGDRYLTAVTLRNKTARPLVLDPRTLRGAWLAATFQHNRLLRAGDEADRTVVYLISARPFAASL